MNELIKAIQDAVKGFYTAVNAAVAPLPPVEQFEANAELSSGLRMMKYCSANLIEQAKQLEGVLTGKMTEAFANAEKAAIATAIAGMIPQSDHEAAITAAVEGAKKSVTEEITAKFETRHQAGEKRAALTDIPTVVASRIPDEVLLSAEAPAALTSLKARLTKLGAIGLTPENSPVFLAEVATLPFTADGDTAFAARIAPSEASFLAARAAAPPPKNPALDAVPPADAAGKRRFL